MMMQNAIANRYAKAIILAANRDNCYQQISADFNLLIEVLSKNDKFQRFIIDPLINPQLKLESLLKSFKSDLHSLSVSFLKLLSKKNRLSLLLEIIDEFEILKRKQNKILKGTITSAIALSNTEVQQIKQKFSTDSEYTYEFETLIEKDLLGGFLIRINDRVIDWSLRNKLNTLKERLSA